MSKVARGVLQQGEAAEIGPWSNGRRISTFKSGGLKGTCKLGLDDRLAPKYEQRTSKHPVGQYRERVGTNIEMVYRKVVQKA